MNYKVVIMYDNEYEGYIVDVPELVGCMSQGVRCPWWVVCCLLCVVCCSLQVVYQRTMDILSNNTQLTTYN